MPVAVIIVIAAVVGGVVGSKKSSNSSSSSAASDNNGAAGSTDAPDGTELASIKTAMGMFATATNSFTQPIYPATVSFTFHNPEVVCLFASRTDAKAVPLTRGNRPTPPLSLSQHSSPRSEPMMLLRGKPTPSSLETRPRQPSGQTVPSLSHPLSNGCNYQHSWLATRT